MGAQRKALHAELPLAERLRARIARDGPISVEAYMQACLADADGGYYATRQPIGKDGDFVTAPGCLRCARSATTLVSRA